MLGWISTTPESKYGPVRWRLLGVQVTVGDGAWTVAVATGEILSQSLQLKASAKVSGEKQRIVFQGQRLHVGLLFLLCQLMLTNIVSGKRHRKSNSHGCLQSSPPVRSFEKLHLERL